MLLFGLQLPTDAGRWLTFAVVFLLGVAVVLAARHRRTASLPRTAKSAAAVVNPPFVVLQFISGVFILYVDAARLAAGPSPSLFPLKWMAQGFRSVFLPDASRSPRRPAPGRHG